MRRSVLPAFSWLLFTDPTECYPELMVKHPAASVYTSVYTSV